MMHFERSVKDKRKHEWQVNYFMGVIIEKKGQRCVVSSELDWKAVRSTLLKVSLRFTGTRWSWKEVNLKAVDKKCLQSRREVKVSVGFKNTSEPRIFISDSQS